MSQADGIIQDARFAVRSFLRSPRFTIPALLALALGIGATGAVFSVVRGVMLNPLPYHDPERVVVIWETARFRPTSPNVIAPANFVAWREQVRSLEHIGMAEAARADVVVNGRPDEFEGFMFSADAFAALGVQPMLGRAYTAAEDTDGHDAVIVLSHAFWQTRLGGRSDVLNISLTTSGRVRSVVGVMPRDFTVMGQRADFLIPYGQTVEQLRSVRGRGNSFGVARLRDGVSLEQARTEMRTIAAQREKEAPQLNTGRTVILVPIHEEMIDDVRPALFALIGAVALVLLVACVNVANLLLARSAARERELAMRTALGARRGRLVRQMLTESVVLAGAGAVAGLAVASLFHRGLLVLAGDRIAIPRFDQTALDLPVVLFMMATAVVTGIAFGLVPAFVSTTRAADAIREGGRYLSGRRVHRVLGTLVVVEVALALALLAAAGVLTRSFIKLQRVDPGFRQEGVLAARVELPPIRYDNAKAHTFFREALSRMSGLPGVQNVAGTPCLPLTGPCIGTSFWRADQPPPANGQAPSARVQPVTPGFFRTLEIPQLAGRDFSASDTAESMPVAIVSETLARQHFATDSPLGRRLRVNVTPANEATDVEWTIVGVVRDIKFASLDGPVGATIYMPDPQLPRPTMRFLLRTGGNPLAHANSVTRIVHDIDPELALADVRTYEDIVAETTAQPRAVSVLVGVFAVLAVSLAAVGVYGVMAFSVLERTQEIGVRMALGATTTSVFGMVLRQAIGLVATGVAVGLVAAGVFTRLLDQLLYDMEPFDPWTFGLTALVLLIVATIASLMPARRGMKMAPVDALRVTN